MSAEGRTRIDHKLRAGSGGRRSRFGKLSAACSGRCTTYARAFGREEEIFFLFLYGFLSVPGALVVEGEEAFDDFGSERLEGQPYPGLASNSRARARAPERRHV
jgi:hypothetical protein